LRSINAKVVLRNGELLAYLRGDGADIQTFLPEDEPDRSHAANALAAFLAVRGHEHSRKPGHRRGGGTLIETINDAPAMEHFLANALVNNGYYAGSAGMQLRRLATPFAAPVEDVVETAEADA
jgi:ATP-dependent Lhr-like helicase